LKSIKIKNLTHIELAEILINYLTISELTKKFYSVYFELEQNFVSKLDLADVEYEVRGWKADFKNNIKELSEITGLENLNHLTHLNISNNQIKNIQDLIQLKNLTHLYLSNNKIQNLINLEYIKKIPNLKYIDLAGNQITDYLTSESIMNIEINLRKYYH
jgi:Leucine-rich repeat (LRR) protein